MPSDSDSGAPDVPEPDAVYGPEYYETHCGPIPCGEASPVWQEHNERVADAIVLTLTPRRVFDAGCSEGLLVAALVDRNVDADGRDISSYAITQVRQDIRSHCSVGSIVPPGPPAQRQAAPPPGPTERERQCRRERPPSLIRRHALPSARSGDC
jgi:hypothetical protein